MPKNDGGPAFQVPMPGVYSGMTLRDYFASGALSGMLSDPEVTGSAQNLAQSAYILADAMIIEREK